MSTPSSSPGRSRSPTTYVLLFLAVLLAVIAAFVAFTTALGFAHADVRGHRLTGALEILFLAGLSGAALGAGAAAIGLWRRRAWAVPALAAIWPAFALVCLVLDRITPASGTGRPLWFYLIIVALVPAAATVLIGRGQRADERMGS
jgi:hypothetical protein